MEKQGRLEAMNASPYHSKVKVSLKLPEGTFVAGDAVTGKMEMECKSDRGLGIGVIMVEIFAVEGMLAHEGCRLAKSSDITSRAHVERPFRNIHILAYQETVSRPRAPTI